MIPSTMEELEKIKKDCLSMVNKRATASAAAAVLPLPGVDVGADVAIMMNLLPKINRKFGLSAEQVEQLNPELRAKILVMATSIGSQLIGKFVKKETVIFLLKKVSGKIATKQVTKYIPFIGQAVSAGISFGAMKYLGVSHVNDCYEICRRIILEKSGK
ncbi:MAG: hypothetical protein ACO1OC_13130 [Tuberibacillus sp.]